MHAQVFNKIQADQASEICRDIDIDSAARDMLVTDISPPSFLGSLIDRSLYPDAVKFLARALPPREATWWAYVCVRSILDCDTSQSVMAAMSTVERWVYEKTEEGRRAAYVAAQVTNFNHPASWVAMAAFWSGGSMSPVDAPVVPPARNLSGKAAAGAIMLATVLDKPEKAPEKYRLFLESGIDIANSGNGGNLQRQGPFIRQHPDGTFYLDKQVT